MVDSGYIPTDASTKTCVWYPLPSVKKKERELNRVCDNELMSLTSASAGCLSHVPQLSGSGPIKMPLFCDWGRQRLACVHTMLIVRSH